MADSPTLKRNKAGVITQASSDDMVKLLLGSRADPADSPMGSNKRSPKELAEIIGSDAALVENRAKFLPKDGGRLKRLAIERLKDSSDRGEYAVPEAGDLGQFLKKGGKVKRMAAGGSASKRADGIAQRGKTKGRMC